MQALEKHLPQSSVHHDGNAVTNGLGLGQVMGDQEGPLLCVFNGCLDHLPEVRRKINTIKKKSTGKKRDGGDIL